MFCTTISDSVTSVIVSCYNLVYRYYDRGVICLAILEETRGDIILHVSEYHRYNMIVKG